MCFLSIMRTCGIIPQKISNRKTSYIVEKVKWIAFLSQYKVCDIEISTSKFTNVIDNKDKEECYIHSYWD